MTFTLKKTQSIPSLEIEASLFEHPTGAQHLHLARDNYDNVFVVAMVTAPQDSSGAAHILEHTALCGSENYPVRDPFFLMLRRSIASFMNAMTSSDWTAYPFSSPNEQDFYNLLDIYLDAVFFPNLHPLDFAQEGHRLEFENDKLQLKGVVYNEMKGAMSSSLDTQWHAICQELYSQTTYHYNSGGDPQQIPKLTYENLVAFHHKHYTPANCVFISVGDLCPKKLQKHIQESVLQHIPAGDSVQITPEPQITTPKSAIHPYATQETENADKVTLSWLFPPVSYIQEQLAIKFLQTILFDSSASPLRQALEDTTLGQALSPLCGIDNNNRQTMCIIGLDGTSAAQATQIEQFIVDTLQQICTQGIAPELIQASLNQFLIVQQQAALLTKNLDIALSIMPQLLAGEDCFASLDIQDSLDRLRQECTQADFIPKLINKYLLDNPHRVLLTLQASDTLAEQRQEQEQQLLHEKKLQLSEMQKQTLIQQAQDLDSRQNSQMDLSCLPNLYLQDIKVPHEQLFSAHENKLKENNLYYQLPTNNMDYLDIIIPTSADPASLRLLGKYLSQCGYGKTSHRQAQNNILNITSGLDYIYTQKTLEQDKNSVCGSLKLHTSALEENSKKMQDLATEHWQEARFDELDCFQTIASKLQTEIKSTITHSAHYLAMNIACRNHSYKSLQDFHSDALPYIELIDYATQQPEAVLERLAQIKKDCTQHTQALYSTIDYHPQITATHRDIQAGDYWQNSAPKIERIKQAYIIDSDVNFCAAAYTLPNDTQLEDRVALSLVASYLKHQYLHQAIRETGGAYGGGATIIDNSLCFFSYRDPRMEETFADFEKSLNWLLTTPIKDSELENVKISMLKGYLVPQNNLIKRQKDFQRYALGQETLAQSKKRFLEMESYIRNIRSENMIRVAKKYLIGVECDMALVTGNQTKATAAGFNLY